MIAQSSRYARSWELMERVRKDHFQRVEIATPVHDDGDPHYLPPRELAERPECQARVIPIRQRNDAGRLGFNDWLWLGLVVGAALVVLKSF